MGSPFRSGSELCHPHRNTPDAVIMRSFPYSSIHTLPLVQDTVFWTSVQEQGLLHVLENNAGLALPSTERGLWLSFCEVWSGSRRGQSGERVGWRGRASGERRAGRRGRPPRGQHAEGDT